VKPSPANPVAHQSSGDQDVFRTSIATRTCFHSCVLFRSYAAVVGRAFPVLRKDGQGRVSCLGAYVVVDLLERWTGDRSSGRSVAGEGQAGTVGEEHIAETKSGRGYRFYHAVLQRTGDWHNASTAAAASSSGAGSCRVMKSCSGSTKRRRH
jgi:hypothetical protein